MRRFGFASLASFLFVLAACSSDSITPSDGKLPGSVVTPPQAVNEPVACSAELVEAHLTALMAVLVPNDNSALSKFQTVKDLLAAGSIAEARDFAQNNLIGFIELKYGQATPEEQAEQAEEFEQVKAEILCFVGLFTIPTSNTPKVVVTSNQLMGIWFPEGFCDGSCAGINVALDILTACTEPGVPAGCTPAPFGTLLDLYGNYLKVTLTGGTPNLLTEDEPIVAICAPDGTQGIVEQLRILHQEDGTSDTEGLTILDDVAIPTELDALLLCDSYALNDTEEAAPTSMFARMVNSLADFLLPQKASANGMFFGGLGIGGTTRTFSPFVIGSTTFSATGIGGTKTTFSPAHPDAPAAAPALATDVNGNLIDSVYHKQYSDLPGVSVKTGLGTAIPGVTVTFTVNDPETAPYDATPSSASVCDAGGNSQGSLVATTNAEGFAALPCVDFGATVGFRNLKATIDPSTAEEVAGGGIGELTVAACDPTCDLVGTATTELNWLVQTTAASAAKLTIESMATTAAAGAAFDPQPVLNVRDQYDNLVLTNSVVVTAGATAPTGGTGGLINTSTPTSASGVVTFSNLGIGGTAGVWNVTFSSGTLTGANQDVTVTAGDALTIKTYMGAGPTAAQTYTYTTGLVPGNNASPAPQVIVQDAYGNGVGNTPLTWSPLLGSNGSVLTLGGAGTTTAAGTAQVTSWTFGDGLSQLSANIAALPDETPAQFSATTPTGVPNFSCTVGSSKRDLVPWSTPRPNGSVKEVTIWMSVTGQSNATHAYPATLRIYESSGAFASPTGVAARTVVGSVTLPGNNGNATAVTFSLPTSLPRISGNNTLYFKLDVTADPTRKFQLWYASSGFSNSSDCAKALMYPSYPTLSPTIKGLRIQLTN